MKKLRALCTNTVTAIGKHSDNWMKKGVRVNIAVGLVPLLFFLSSPVLADHDFKYKNTYACGPSVVNDIPQDEIEKSEYFIISDNDAGDKFSILNSYEYSSFQKVHLSELFLQSGGVRWLSFKYVGESIIRFELHTTKQKERYERTVLIFDKAGMSAVRQDTWRKGSRRLVCWDYYAGFMKSLKIR